MNAMLERKLRVLGFVTVGGASAGLLYAFLHQQNLAVGTIAGILFSFILGGAEVATMDGPLRLKIGSLSFTARILIRSGFYAVVIIAVQWLRLAEKIAGLSGRETAAEFWSTVIYAALVSILFNLLLSITNLIGARALLNFITGRYHHPTEEERFVLFVDISGSTGLAQRLGGIGIHRFLDRTFRLLTRPVVEFRGEVLDYVGDEVIVTWPAQRGAVDHRPLRCFMAMRDELARAADDMWRDFGTAPQIRGSLHFGPVIVGEIGDVKRAIAFNGDVMNTAARLEQLSQDVDGGFLASRAAMERLAGAPPCVICEVGRLPIRGRADGIDVVALQC
jgi:adenylate cyclase